MWTRALPRFFAILLIAVVAMVPLTRTPVVAAPLDGAGEARLAAQNVDWMSAEQAAQLDLSFPVMVPTWIPSPFGGSPSIQGGGGYYSLYWMISGGAPTFLHITGEVGAGLPVGSPADLNVRLEVNASVQGYDAIHDVTSIYDNVWWVAGGVRYTVSSNNMTGTDSLSLANSLIALQPPAPEPAPEPTPTPEPAPIASGEIFNASSIASGGTATIEAYPSGSSTLSATGGSFTQSGSASISGFAGGSVSWRAPTVSSQTTVEFALVDDATGVVTAGSSITVSPSTSGGSANTGGSSDSGGSSESGGSSGAGGSTSEESDGSGSTSGNTGSSPRSTATATETDDDDDLSDIANQLNDNPRPTPTATAVPAVQTPAAGGTNGAFASDGTAGPEVPRTGDGTAGADMPSGGDGTGGVRQIVLP